MKFVSKFSNYRITLTPGIPGNALLGNPPKAAVYVKFEDGVANVDNENLINMMKQHPAFLSGDFIEVKDGDNDPYQDGRKQIEPEHNIAQVVHGSTVNLNPPSKNTFTTEQKKIMSEMISEGIKQGIKEMMESSQAVIVEEVDIVPDKVLGKNKNVTKPIEIKK